MQHAQPELTGHLRAICLALPEATEQQAWGDPTYRIGGKMFALEKRGDGRVSVWCKAPDGLQAVMIADDPARFFVPPYLGPKGWIGIRLDTDDPRWTEVAGLLARSYRLIAPKRLALRA